MNRKHMKTEEQESLYSEINDESELSLIMLSEEQKIELIHQKNQQLFANKQDLDYLYKVIRMLREQIEERDKYIEKLLKRYKGTTPVVDDGSGRELRFTKCGSSSILESE